MDWVVWDQESACFLKKNNVFALRQNSKFYRWQKCSDMALFVELYVVQQTPLIRTKWKGFNDRQIRK
jgi:hypothetical protein